MKQDISNIQAGIRKGRNTRNHIANICWYWIISKNFRNNSICTLYIMAKPLTIWIMKSYGSL